jgi:hypothetical protein
MKTEALRNTVPLSQLARRDEVIESPQFRRRTLLHLLTAVSGTGPTKAAAQQRSQLAWG